MSKKWQFNRCVPYYHLFLLTSVLALIRKHSGLKVVWSWHQQILTKRTMWKWLYSGLQLRKVKTGAKWQPWFDADKLQDPTIQWKTCQDVFFDEGKLKRLLKQGTWSSCTRSQRSWKVNMLPTMFHPWRQKMDNHSKRIWARLKDGENTLLTEKRRLGSVVWPGETSADWLSPNRVET